LNKHQSTASGSGSARPEGETADRLKYISLEVSTTKEIFMSKRFRRLSHTIYECKYHLIFCPKYRRRILKDEIREYTRREIENLLRQKEGIEVIEMNVQSDHVHLVVWIPPKYAVSEVMGYLKGKLAIRIFQRYEKLGKQFWGKRRSPLF
jgi:putative transposase